MMERPLQQLALPSSLRGLQSRPKQSKAAGDALAALDCFVAALLAMTGSDGLGLYNGANHG